MRPQGVSTHTLNNTYMQGMISCETYIYGPIAIVAQSSIEQVPEQNPIHHPPSPFAFPTPSPTPWQPHFPTHSASIVLLASKNISRKSGDKDNSNSNNTSSQFQSPAFVTRALSKVGKCCKSIRQKPSPPVESKATYCVVHNEKYYISYMYLYLSV